jgi:hypothetical protein
MMKKKSPKQNTVQEDKPNRVAGYHGSTTQGGSNFGQGSLQLGNNSIAQGAESNTGASYNGEEGWNNEALRKEDLPKKKK